MKQTIIVLSVILFFLSCDTGSISRKLSEVDSLVMMEEYDSAYRKVLSLDGASIKNDVDIAHLNLLKVQTGYLVNRPLPSADSLIDKVISFYHKSNNPEKLADAYYYKAVSCSMRKDFKQSIQFYKKAEVLANENENLHQQYKISEGISFVNRMNKKYDLQLKYAKKAYSLAKTLDRKNWVAYSCYSIQYAYLYLGYKDSAYIFLQEIPLYIRYAKKSELPVLLTTLGYYLRDDHPEEAKQYLREALSYQELTSTYTYLAEVCYNEGKPEEAYQYWKKALALKDSYPKDNIIRNLIEYDLERGKTDSISDMVTQIFEIRDSIDAKLKDDTIKDLQTRFDHELALKEKDRVFVRGILIMTVIIFVLIGVFSAVYFRRRHLAKIQMLDYQMQINDNLRQIEILQASGTDTKQEVERLNKLIEDIMQNKAPKLDRGRMLYDDIMNGNITMIDWNREHEQMFLDYYTATHYNTVKKMKSVRRVEKLTPHKLFYLILVKLGKTDEQIQQMMSVSDSTLRGLKHRTKPI